MTYEHRAASSLVAEHVLQNQPRPSRYVLVREDLGTQREYVLGVGQTQVLDQEPDVLGATTTSREHLHRQQVLRRRRRHPQARMIENTGSGHVAARCDVYAGLLVEPPRRKAKIASHGTGLLQHHA